MNDIIVALIVGGLSLIGVIITVIAGNRKITTKMEVQQAVTDTKLSVLTDEVRHHNGFAERIPVMEERLSNHDKRIEALERGKSA